MAEKKIPVDELRSGMFVVALDRPWFDTPFGAGGFEIRGQEDIAELRRYCRHAFVEVEDAVEDTGEQETAPDQETAVENALRRAEETLSRFRALLGDLFLEAAGSPLASLAGIDALMPGLLDGIDEDSDAHIWQARLERGCCYDVAHALDCCVLAVAFASHLGWPRQACHTLGKAALLLDIGMARVPRHILDKPGRLTAEEFFAVQRHVLYAQEILAQAAGCGDEVLAIVRNHHERINGSGYPQGLQGEDISLPSQLVAMVDCYTAMTSSRSYRDARSPYQVLNQLYGWRDSYFRGDLLEPFIRFIGIYPTASLVELTNGEVGAVLGQNRPRSLRPKVLLMLEGSSAASPCFLDLAAEENSDVEVRRGIERPPPGMVLDAGLWRGLGRELSRGGTGQPREGAFTGR